MFTEIERKWVLQSPPSLEIIKSYNPTVKFLQQAYLKDSEGTERVRKTTINNISTYEHFIKLPLRYGTFSEEVTCINEKKYLELLLNKDFSRNIIEKTRYVIETNDVSLKDGTSLNANLEIDYFSSIDLHLLEIEFSDEALLTPELILPSWLGEIVEVTGDKNYSNSQLSLKS